MKTIAQLLELKTNPYYVFSPEESKLLNDFLSTQSAQQKPTKTSSDNSEKNIPATVVNKNIVKKHTGVLETSDSEAKAVEEAVHPDAVK